MKFYLVCPNCTNNFMAYAERKFCSRACLCEYVRKPEVIMDRFLGLMGDKNENGCRLWLGTIMKHHGYGQFGYRVGECDIRARAHVFAYAPFVKLDLCVLHKCDVRACVEATHLFLGTRTDNSDDKMRKGRHRFKAPRGEDHGSAKVTEEAVLEMRRMREGGFLLREIGDTFGITLQQAHHIVTHKQWRCVL